MILEPREITVGTFVTYQYTGYDTVYGPRKVLKVLHGYDGITMVLDVGTPTPLHVNLDDFIIVKSAPTPKR